MARTAINLKTRTMKFNEDELPEGLLGPSSSNLKSLRGLSGRLEVILSHLGFMLGRLGGILEASRALLGESWTTWKRLGTVFEAILGHLSRLGGPLGPSWTRTRSALDRIRTRSDPHPIGSTPDQIRTRAPRCSWSVGCGSGRVRIRSCADPAPSFRAILGPSCGPLEPSSVDIGCLLCRLMLWEARNGQNAKSVKARQENQNI